MLHKTIEGKFGKIHYWIQAQCDEWIVFTHGATMDHDLFQFQIDFFSESYSIITWDVPLHGLSKPYSNFSLENAPFELAKILQKENVSQVHLVGQSMGGYISQIFALNYPNLVKTITAVDSSPVQGSYYTKLDRWLLAITPSILLLYPYKTLIQTIASQIALDQFAQAYALRTLEGFLKKEIAHIMEKVYQGLMQYSQDIILSHPILIVYGDRDSTGKVKSYCDRWAEREKRELRVIANAAHNSNMDNPASFNALLDGFLKRS
ncbi:MAG TPA: alpha/beta hydrolase [Anaerolineales bacterium]|nr:alpha/beta hydrolase [Anaerolineales bacterium]